jgi:hypothetical protein
MFIMFMVNYLGYIEYSKQKTTKKQQKRVLTKQKI